MKTAYWMVTTATATALAVAGCSDPGDDSGGDSSLGILGDAGGGLDTPLCQQFEACGGDLVGNWEVTESCVQAWGADTLWGEPPECSGQVTEFSLTTSGSLEITEPRLGPEKHIYGKLPQRVGFGFVVTSPCAEQFAGQPTSRSFCAEAGQGLLAQDELDEAACRFVEDTCHCEVAASGEETIWGDFLVWADVNFSLRDPLTDELTEYSYCVQGEEMTLQAASEDGADAVVYRLRRLP